MTSDDSRCDAGAAKATAGCDDPWQKAVRINNGSTRTSRTKNFTVAFAAANEVAATCPAIAPSTAVLAAAMCRAVGIPSRVVIGLVYVKRAAASAYHMWDEVYVNHRWVAIDPSWNQVDRRRRSHQALRLEPGRRRPFEAFLPIFRVMGGNARSIEPDRVRVDCERVLPFLHIAGPSRCCSAACCRTNSLGHSCRLACRIVDCD